MSQVENKRKLPTRADYPDRLLHPDRVHLQFALTQMLTKFCSSARYKSTGGDSGAVGPRYGVYSILAGGVPMYVYDHPAVVKMCDTAFTDGVHVFWSADFLEKLLREDKKSRADGKPTQSTLPIMVHELSHILFEHIQLSIPKPRKGATKDEKRLASLSGHYLYMGQETVINTTIMKMFEDMGLTAGPLFAGEPGNEKNSGCVSTDQESIERFFGRSEHEVAKILFREDMDHMKQQMVNHAQQKCQNPQQGQQGQGQEGQGQKGQQGQQDGSPGQSAAQSASQLLNELLHERMGIDKNQGGGSAGDKDEENSDQGQGDADTDASGQDSNGSDDASDSQSGEGGEEKGTPIDRSKDKLDREALEALAEQLSNLSGEEKEAIRGQSEIIDRMMDAADQANANGRDPLKAVESEMEKMAAETLKSNHEQSGDPMLGSSQPGGDAPGDGTPDLDMMHPAELAELLEEAGLDAVKDKLRMPDSNDLDAHDEKLQESRDRSIEAAQKATSMERSNSSSKMPGSAAAHALLEKVRAEGKAKLTWQQELRDAVLGDGMRYTYTEEVLAPEFYVDPSEMGLDISPHSGVSIASKSDAVTMVLVDTSGSVSTDMLVDFLVEIQGLAEDPEIGNDIVLMSADTAVQGDPKIIDPMMGADALDEFEFAGRGGTDLKDSIEGALNLQIPELYQREIASIVYFTDLGDFPPKRNQLPDRLPSVSYICPPGDFNESFARQVEDYASVVTIEDGNEVSLDKIDDDVLMATGGGQQEEEKMAASA